MIINLLIFSLLSGCGKNSEETNKDINLPPEKQSNYLDTSDGGEIKTPTIVSKGVYQLITDTDLRVKPSTNSAVVITLEQGTPVELIETRTDGWSEILHMNFYDFEQGYVQTEVLSKADVYDNVDKCSDVSIYYDRIQKLEPEKLSKYNAVAKRDKDVLEITLENGQRLEFTNKPGIDHEYYNFVDFYQDVKYLIIAVYFSEDSSLKLINHKNGEILDIETFPIFSPDKKRFIVSYPSEPLAEKNFLQIFNIDNEKPTLVQEIDSTECMYSNPKWISNDEIEFTKNYYYFFLDRSRGLGFVYLRDSVRLIDNK